jgi:hypothetical protein
MKMERWKCMKKVGRPRRKPNYDAENVRKQLVEAITDSYLNPGGERGNAGRSGA